MIKMSIIYANIAKRIKGEYMNIIKKAFCRIFQRCMYIAYPFLPYREPEVINGGVNGIPKVLKKNNKKHPLIVTDKGCIAAGLIESIKKVLEECDTDYVVYDAVVPNPTTAVVEKGKDIYKSSHCDSLIAVGGGSAMDSAKAIGALVVNKNKTLGKMKGILKVRHKIPLLIAIPTTAGTGSEATLAAVVVDALTRNKYAINDFLLIPHYAVLDAHFTLTLPPVLTATTGMDAMTHAIEAYIGKSSYKLTRREAKCAFRLIYNNIYKAYTNGNDYAARSAMAKAAYLAGCAFTRSYVGYVHALSHALSGKYNTPHGEANAVLLPYVLEAYGKSVYKKLRKLAICIGVADELTPEETAAKAFIQTIRDLNEKLNIPKTTYIKKEDIPSLATHAEKEANPLYPVPQLWGKKELESIYYTVADKWLKHQ